MFKLCGRSTHTVGLWRPLWSTTAGEGLCPAFKAAAPTAEDRDWGGGGRASWNYQTHLL